MGWTRQHAIDTTLARRNLDKLKAAGLPVDEAYQSADRWALFDIEVVGHRYADAKLWILLKGTGPGALEYETQYHLGRVAA